MRFKLKGDDRLMAQARKAKAQLQVELVLGRFGEQVRSVVLRFSPGPPSQGPATRRCEIVVDIKPERVQVEHTDVDLAVAIKRALAKAARSIARVLDTPPGGSKVVPLTQAAASERPKRSARVA